MKVLIFRDSEPPSRRLPISLVTSDSGSFRDTAMPALWMNCLLMYASFIWAHEFHLGTFEEVR
jgi:hypothetical protein